MALGKKSPPLPTTPDRQKSSRDWVGYTLDQRKIRGKSRHQGWREKFEIRNSTAKNQVGTAG